MDHVSGKGLAGLALGLAGLALILGIRPWVLAIYHTEVGAREVEAALRPVFPDRLAPEHIQDPTRLAQGIAHLRAALAWDPHHLAARRWLARAYAAQDRPAEALEILEPALRDFPSDPRVALELGDLLDMRGEAERAIQLYERGRIGSRRLPLVANYLKLADEVRRENLDLAARLYQRALALDPGNLYASYRLLEFYRHLGDRAGIEEMTGRLRRFGPESVRIRVDLDFRLPRAEASAMIALVEDGIWDLGTLRRVIRAQLALAAEGLPGLMVDQALEILRARRPQDPHWVFDQAELRHRRGEKGQAESLYRAALDLDPHLARAWLRLGMLKEDEGTPEARREAAAFYRRYVEAVPDDLWGWQRWLRACEGLEGDPSCAGSTDGRRYLAERTDDRHIAADLLGIPEAWIELGENRLASGDFEEWKSSEPQGWNWSDMSNAAPWAPGLFIGIPETLEVYQGRVAARVDGLWTEAQEGREPARAGYWSRSVPMTPGEPYLLSFAYRADLAPGSWVGTWLPGHPELRLPDTGGNWRYVGIIARSPEDGQVRPLLRLWGEGEAVFDAVALRALQIPREYIPADLPRVAVR